MAYSTVETGSKYSESYKAYVVENGRPVSPFHDIPLRNGKYVNCINEIPRFERAKFEISKSVSFNPIMQDIKKGKVRFVKNIYPFFGYQFNYGALPQTWECPSTKDKWANAHGDNDPLDVLEIGTRRKGVGEVYEAKVLGVLGLLDDGEADWKVFVIDVKDEMADDINDIEDVRKIHPDILDNAFKWFRDYKVPDGKPRNSFVFEGEFKNAEFANQVICEAHDHWKELIKNGYEGISCSNATISGSKGYEPSFTISDIKEDEASLPDGLEIFSYVS
ncbi:hypothetical protein PAEPH01_1614 [Pancytospora epiphaga]|nr:hypothetical protein PAEPH01_1614 [Pancytospora epiphaga]